MVTLRDRHRGRTDDEHLAIECDIYSPCARGAGINDDTIPLLHCRAIAGCANNQMLEPRHAAAVRDRGILYAPDYVINAGGLMSVNAELHGLPAGKAMEDAGGIFDTVKRVLNLASAEGITPDIIIDRLVTEVDPSAAVGAGVPGVPS